MLVAALTTAPDGSGTPIVAIVSCHIGSPEDAEIVGRKIRSFGTVAVDALGPIPYVDLNGMLDAGFPSGAFNYWKSTFLPRLDDDAVEALVIAYERCQVPTRLSLMEGFPCSP
ncbi:FAD-linked oxidase, partial [Mesorhizobium sp. M3A.F.Ca.ET.175.01.1.1]